MQPQNLTPETPYQNWLSPNLTQYWKIAKHPTTNQILLCSKQGKIKHPITPEESFAIQHFTGTLTLGEIQQKTHQKYPHIPPNFIPQLLQKFITLNILENPTPQPQKPKLKPHVHWIEHPDGYWILRNPEDLTFLQLNHQDKTIIEQLQQRPTNSIISEFCITPEHLKHLLQLLTVTAMLEGTTPPQPPQKKFSPLRLLSFRIRLFNPDPFLTRYIKFLRWIWTPAFAFFLLTFLTISATIGLNQSDEIFHTGQQLIQTQGSNLIIPFALLATLVVTIHEFGHAFTLKNYNGIVPEIGLLIIMFMPAAYTNTTDSYCLPRFKRVLVVGAGLLVQFIITAIALLLWNISTTGTWLHTGSYLLMTAALFTVALNLNPLAKFDGYYLVSAITGINNLRSRSFNLYKNLLTGKPIQETQKDAIILATYAPLSLIYIWLVFGFLIINITQWVLTNLPTTTLILFTLWAIYYYLPRKNKN